MTRRFLRFFRTARGHLVLMQVAVLAVAVVVADFSIFRLAIQPVGDLVDLSLNGEASAIHDVMAEQGGKVVLTAGHLPDRTDEGAAVAAAVVQGNAILFQTAQAPLPADQLVQLAGQVLELGPYGPQDRSGLSGAPYRVYAEPQTIGASELKVVVIVARSLNEVRAGIARSYLLLGLGSLLVLTLAGVLANQLVWRTLQPVREIAGVARGLTQSGLFHRVEASVTDDELAELVDTFNGMLDRLQASFESLRRFTADASHELRAPLTVMRSEVDVALTLERTPDEYRLVLGRVEGEIQHLTRIADQLLVLARADAGALEPAQGPLDVADVLNELAARWSPVAHKGSLTLDVDAPDTGEVLGDDALTRRILDNLVENAIRHSPAVGTIRLRAERDGSFWGFTVADQGLGVPEEYRSRIFQRFARPDGSRGRGGGGAGLGLALSSAVAQAQGGSLELISEPGWGSVFRLRLPAHHSVSGG